jgi:hypothetical protein
MQQRRAIINCILNVNAGKFGGDGSGDGFGL